MTSHKEKTTEQLIEALDKRADKIRDMREHTVGGTLVSTNTSVMVDQIEELKERYEDGEEL